MPAMDEISLGPFIVVDCCFVARSPVSISVVKELI